MNTQPLPLEVKNSNRGVHSQRVTFRLHLLNEVYSFCYLCVSVRTCDEVFVHIASQLNLHLSLHLLCGLCASLWSVYLAYSGVPQSAENVCVWFCECSAGWINSTSFHCVFLLSRYVLSCQVFMWCFFSMPSFRSDSYSTMTVAWMSMKNISSKGKNYTCFPDGCLCLASNLLCSKQTGRQVCVVPRSANSKVAAICLCALQVAAYSFLGRLKNHWP